MQDDVKELYDGLINDGYTSDQIGSEKEFRDHLKEDGGAKELYDGLISDGYTADQIGTYDEFNQHVSPAQPAAQPAAPATDPTNAWAPTPAKPKAQQPARRQQTVSHNRPVTTGYAGSRPNYQKGYKPTPVAPPAMLARPQGPTRLIQGITAQMAGQKAAAAQHFGNTPLMQGYKREERKQHTPANKSVPRTIARTVAQNENSQYARQGYTGQDIKGTKETDHEDVQTIYNQELQKAISSGSESAVKDAAQATYQRMNQLGLDLDAADDAGSMNTAIYNAVAPSAQGMVDKATSDIFDQVIKGAETEASEIWKKYNQDSKFVDAASPWSVETMREANQKLDPEVLSDKLVKAIQKQGLDRTFKDVVAKAKLYGYDPKDYFKTYVLDNMKNLAALKLEKYQVQRFMPKNDLEYVLSGFGDGLSGMFFDWLTKSGKTNQYKQQAMQSYQTDSTTGKIAKTAVGLIGQTPEFILTGGVASAATKKIFGKAIADMVAKGATEAEANAIMQATLASKFGTRVANTIMQSSVSGAINFGTLEGVSEAARQIRDDDFNMAKIAGAAARGTGSGLIFGTVSGAIGGATAELTGAKKVISNLLSVPVNGAALTTSSNVMNMVNIAMGGEDELAERDENGNVKRDKDGNVIHKSIWEQWADNSLQDLMMRATSVHNAKTAVGLLRKGSREQSIAQILSPFDSRSNSQKMIGDTRWSAGGFSEEAQKRLMEATGTDNLRDALMYGVPGAKDKYSIRGPKEEVKASSQSVDQIMRAEQRQVMAENWDKIMNDPEIPAEDKERLAGMMRAKYHRNPTVKLVTRYEDGKTIIEERDAKGLLNERHVFDNDVDADDFQEEHENEIQTNSVRSKVYALGEAGKATLVANAIRYSEQKTPEGKDRTPEEKKAAQEDYIDRFFKGKLTYDEQYDLENDLDEATLYGAGADKIKVVNHRDGSASVVYSKNGIPIRTDKYDDAAAANQAAERDMFYQDRNRVREMEEDAADVYSNENGVIRQPDGYNPLQATFEAQNNLPRYSIELAILGTNPDKMDERRDEILASGATSVNFVTGPDGRIRTEEEDALMHKYFDWVKNNGQQLTQGDNETSTNEQGPVAAAETQQPQQPVQQQPAAPQVPAGQDQQSLGASYDAGKNAIESNDLGTLSQIVDNAELAARRVRALIPAGNTINEDVMNLTSKRQHQQAHALVDAAADLDQDQKAALHQFIDANAAIHGLDDGKENIISQKIKTAEDAIKAITAENGQVIIVRTDTGKRAHVASGEINDPNGSVMVRDIDENNQPISDYYPVAVKKIKQVMSNRKADDLIFDERKRIRQENDQYYSDAISTSNFQPGKRVTLADGQGHVIQATVVGTNEDGTINFQPDGGPAFPIRPQDAERMIRDGREAGFNLTLEQEAQQRAQAKAQAEAAARAQAEAAAEAERMKDPRNRLVRTPDNKVDWTHSKPEDVAEVLDGLGEKGRQAAVTRMQEAQAAIDQAKAQAAATAEETTDLDALLENSENQPQNDAQIQELERQRKFWEDQIAGIDQRAAEKAAAEKAKAERKEAERLKRERAERRRQAAYNKPINDARKRLADDPEAAEILSEQNREPRTLEEAVAELIPAKGLSMDNWTDGAGVEHLGIAGELGVSAANMKRLKKFIGKPENGAVDITTLSERIYDDLPEEIKHQAPNGNEDVRNTLIKILSEAQTADDIEHFVDNARIAEAESRYEENRAYEQALAEHEQEQGITNDEPGKQYDASEDPFAGGESGPAPFSFTGNSPEEIARHNERARSTGGLVIDNESRRLDGRTSALLDAIGRQLGKTIVIDPMMITLHANGQASDGGKVLHLSPKLISSQDGMLRVITGHELTHLIKAASAKEGGEILDVWDDFVKTVSVAMGDNWNQALADKRAFYDHMVEKTRQTAKAILEDPNATPEQKAQAKQLVNMRNLTDAQIAEEVVADWVGDHVFTDEDFVKKMMQRVEAGKGDSVSIAKRMKNFIDKILNYLQGIKNPTLSEKRALIAAQRAKDIWSDMYELSAAKQREAQGKKSGTTAEIANADPADESANKIMKSDDGDVIVSENKLTGTTSFNYETEVNPSFTVNHHQWSSQEYRNFWIDNKVKGGKMTKEQGQYIKDFMKEQTERARKQGEDSKEMQLWNNATIAVDEKGRPMFTVVIPDAEYPINFGISLVCKRRRALDRVMRELASTGIIDQLVADPLNIVAINQIIKEHGLEVGCDLCYVEARRFRSIPNADKFTAGWNEMISSLDPEGKFAPGHHNFGENQELTKADEADTRQALDQAGNDDLDFTFLDKVMEEERQKAYAKAKKEGKPKPKQIKSVRYKQAQFIKQHPEVRRLLDRSDFVDSKGFENAHKKNKPILAMFNGTFGASNPKNSLGDTPYNSEILRRDKFFTTKKAYKLGGIRFQSFDDYVGKNWLDYLMAHADMAVRGIPAHSYSKEELYVKQFGLTGNKINMSGVPDAVEGAPAGLDKDGNYLFHEGYDIEVNHRGEKKIVKTDRQTFPWATAVDIRRAPGYRDNCGTIVVGASDEHIWKMMHDVDVDMIIPYHASSLNPVVAHAMGGVGRFTDYTNIQNERYGSSHGDKAGNSLTAADKAKIPNVNLLMAPKSEGGQEMSPRQAIETYVRYCEDHDILPKFDKFCCKREGDAFDGKEQYYTDENGVRRRVIDDGYCKTIFDFKVIAQDENGKEYDVPQRAVHMTLPGEEDAFGSFNKLTDRGVEEWQTIHDDIESELYREDGKGIMSEINDRIINGSMTQGLHELSDKRRKEYERQKKEQQMQNVNTPEEAEEANQGGVSFSFVEDPAEIKRLDKEDKITAYRSMQLVEIDGENYLVPPMASKVNGEWVDPIHVNADGTVDPVWLRSDEHPELVPATGKNRNKFYLDKGNGKGLWAAYNPYNHLASTMLNDQFAEAQSRPNLVSVACLVPKSEADADPATAYHAEKAKDSVGRHDWKAGPIQGNLTGTRELILSRWCQPAKVVPNDQVAQDIYNKINGQIDVMPTNVVSPAVRQELEKMGVKFIETNNSNELLTGEHYGDRYTWWYGKNAAKNYRKHLRETARKHGMTPQEYQDLRNQYREQARQEGTSIQKMLEKYDPRFAKDAKEDQPMFAYNGEEDKNREHSQNNSQNILSSQENVVPLHPEVQQDINDLITPEEREESRKAHENDPKMKIKSLSYISDASKQGKVIPYDILKEIPEIKAAQAKVDADKNPYDPKKSDIKKYATALLENYHSANIHEDGSITFDGEVAHEKKLFLIIGPPAAGKSSVFANPLSSKYKARIIDADDAKKTLPGFDGGHGASHVHNASAKIANAATWRAIKDGENIIVPRVGGSSVIDTAIFAKKLGYTVNLYFNDIPTENSIMRAAARFAETGRYLSLKYLKTNGSKSYDTLLNYYNKKVYEADESRAAERAAQAAARGAESTGTVNPGSGERRDRLERNGGHNGELLDYERLPLFDYIEWKNNNVPFGTKPVEVWNSESGKPLPDANGKVTVEAITNSENFKNFFGDWQNDPEGSSKVVDAEGKPLILSHGTPYYGFTVFNTYSNKFGERNMGSHFGSAEAASDRLRQMGSRAGTTETGTYNVFLDIRKPWECTDWFDQNDSYMLTDLAQLALKHKDNAKVQKYWGYIKNAEPWSKKYTDKQLSNGKHLDDGIYDLESFKYDDLATLYDFARGMVEAAGYDGIKYWNDAEGNGYSWIAFNPEQIKSADTEGPMANNGNFDKTNPDIRFSFAEDETTKNVYDPLYKDVSDDKYEVKDLSREGEARREIYEDPTLAGMRDYIHETAKDNDGRINDAAVGAFRSEDGIRGIADPAKAEDIAYDMVTALSRYRRLLERKKNSGDRSEIRRRVYDETIADVDKAITWYEEFGQGKHNVLGDHADDGIRFSYDDDEYVPDPEKTQDQKDREDSAAFKNWFGDWEKDPDNASKVVDKDGRPLIVHHGSRNYGFTVFDTRLSRLDRRGEEDLANIGSHFGALNTAKQFDENNIYNVYLDIKHPFETFDFFADNYQNAYLEVLAELRDEIGTPEADQIFEKVKEIYPHLTDEKLQEADEEGYAEVFEDDEGLETEHWNSGMPREEADRIRKIHGNNRNRMVGLIKEMLKLGGYDGLKYENWYEGEDENVCWVALEPTQIKSADTEGPMANNGNFDPQNPDIRFSYEIEKSDPFYSNAAKAVVDIKQNKATGEQWIAMLKKNGGLKAEEDKWMGLSDWLKDKKTVTKDEIRQFIAANSIKVEEVNYEDRGGDREDVSIYTDMLDREFENLRVEFGPEEAFEKMKQRHPGLEEYVDLAGNYIDWEPAMEYEGEFGNWALKDSGSKDGTRAINPTRLAYTTEGLENNHEIALTVPNVDPYNVDDWVHFGDAGDGRAVAWVRFGDATDADGNKVIVVDEVQSKRHQDAREHGYDARPEDAQKMAETSLRARQDAINSEKTKVASKIKDPIEQQIADYIFYCMRNENDLTIDDAIGYCYNAIYDATDAGTKEWTEDKVDNVSKLIKDNVTIPEYKDALSYQYQGGVPDAPFQKNWHELAMKRILRYAAENGYDKVAWTTGMQQAERYAIGGVVDEIMCAGKASEGGKYIDINLENGHIFHFVVDDNGKILGEYNGDGDTINGDYSGKNLSDLIGKDAANQAMNLEDYKAIKGGDLSFGGEGMKGFYDNMLVKYMDKYCKKWGTKTQDITLNLPLPADKVMHSVDVTPEMKESVMQGQPMFSFAADTPDRQEQQQKSTAFKNWFGDWEKDPEHASKVVTADGKPLIVYHGSPISDLTVLDPEKAGSHTGAYGDEAIWLTDNKDTADEFSREMTPGSIPGYTVKLGKKGVTYPMYVDMKKPFDLRNIDGNEEMLRQLSEMSGFKPDAVKRIVDGDLEYGNHQLIKTLINYDKLKEYGYDGVIARMYPYESGKDDLEYGVFNPTQIKSATNNNGDFDPQNPDIRFSYDDDKKEDDDIPRTTGYHGSAADFKKFSLMFAGSGEGNKSFGYGVYIATSKDVAKGYARIAAANKKSKDAESLTVKLPNGSTISWNSEKEKRHHYNQTAEQLAASALWHYQLNKRESGYGRATKRYNDATDYIKQKIKRLKEYGNNTSLEEDALKLVEGAKMQPKEDPKRHLYSVSIPEDNGKNYLDWESKLTNEQAEKIADVIISDYIPDFYTKNIDKVITQGQQVTPEEVRNRLHDYIVKSITDNGTIVEEDGTKIPDTGLAYLKLASGLDMPNYNPFLGGYYGKNAKLASEILIKAGFVGIKVSEGYLHTGKENNNKNYIIFNPDDVQITNNIMFSFEDDTVLDVPEGKTKAQLQAEVDQRLAEQKNVVRPGDTMSDVVRKAQARKEAEQRVQIQQTIADNQIKPGDTLETVIRKAEALKAAAAQDQPMFAYSKEEKARRDYERQKKAAERQINEAQQEIRKKVVDEINYLMSDKHMSVINRSTLSRMLKDVQNATTDNLQATVDSVRTEVNRLTDKAQQREIERMMKLKTQDVNGKNMSIAKNVSDSVRRILGMIQGRVVDLKATGYEEDMTQLRRQNIFINAENTRLNNRLERLQQEDPSEGRSLADINADIQAIQDKIQSNTQQHDANLQELRDLRAKKEAAEAAKALAGDDDITEEITTLMKKMDDHVAGNATWTLQDSEKLTGLQILQMKNQADIKRRDIDKMVGQLEDLEDSLDHLKREARKPLRYIPRQRIEQLEQQVASMKAAINAETKSMIGIQGNVIDTISELISEGKNSLINKIEGEKNRKFELLHGMLDDIQGGKSIPTDIKEQGKTHEEGKAKKFFSAQLHSFEYLAKRINENSLGEDGWFYQHFVKGPEGVLAAENNYQTGMRTAVDILDAKAKEIYGKTFNEAAGENSKVIDHSGVFLQVDQAGIPINEEVPLSKAQAMYIYMVWKMPDGKMKLQLQGFTEESIEQCRQFIGDKNAEYADWLQNEFLANQRAKYNDRYVEMYNTSMADIENYVPLKIVSDDVQKDSDLSDETGKRKSLEERAGSLINRRFNTHRVDITHGAFDVIAEHVSQMEEWNAYARLRKDLDYILSNKYVRNQLDANSHGRYQQLYDAAAIAAHAYKPDKAKYMDDVVGWLTKGLVGGNIAFRYTTAMKQMLSVPAFLGYSHDPRYLISLIKNIGVQYALNSPAVLANMISLGFSSKGVSHYKGGIKLADQGDRKSLLSDNVMWCMKNVPSFRSRVMKGTAGMEFLDEDLKGRAGKIVDAYLDYGMATNQMIDAVTCSIGIKSIFDYKYGKMEKAINADTSLSPEEKQNKLDEARRLALTDADIYYNATQQSNHAAFMSPMQMSRSMIDRALSVYQNASIGYARRAASTFENLWKMSTPNKWKALQREYASRYMRDDETLSREEAYSQANSYLQNQMAHNIIGAALYGVALNWIWDWGGRGLLGLFQGSDDDKEAQARAAAGLDINDALDMTEIAGKMAEWSSYPLRGLTGMNISSALVNGNLSQPLLFYSEMDDMKQEVQRYWKDEDYVGIASAALFKGLRVAGFDWKVWHNIVAGTAGLIKDGCTANRDSQAMIDFMLALNTPNSNRKAVAQEIYKNEDLDTYVRNVMKAAKYTTSEYMALLPGMKILTAQRELAIYKEFALNHLAPEEMAKLKTAQKELIKHYKSIEDLKGAYNQTTDPTLKSAIGRQLIKTMLAERPKTAETADQLLAKAKKSLMVTDVKNKAYLKACNADDCLEDEYLKELRQELKPVNDELQEIKMDSPAAAEQYAKDNAKEYEQYKTISAYSEKISQLKGKMEKAQTEEDKKTLMDAIRQVRKMALDYKKQQ